MIHYCDWEDDDDEHIIKFLFDAEAEKNILLFDCQWSVFLSIAICICNC